MKLLDEIIDLASSDKGSVATLLRKWFVLSHTLRNDRLKVWAEKELNGYNQNDNVPEYRKTPTTAKGFFIGPYGTQINDQPLPPAILKPEHRSFTHSVALLQPIASYEGVDGHSRLAIQ